MIKNTFYQKAYQPVAVQVLTLYGISSILHMNIMYVGLTAGTFTCRTICSICLRHINYSKACKHTPYKLMTCAVAFIYSSPKKCL